MLLDDIQLAVRRLSWVRTFVATLLVVATLSVVTAQCTLALPAFARHENLKCQMCHFRLPELLADGHSYVMRGFREKADGMTGMASAMSAHDGKAAGMESPDADAVPTLGDPLALAWQNYLTVFGHSGFDAQRNTRSRFSPGEVEAWIGGPVDEHWSALATFVFDAEAGGVEVEQGYAHYISSRAEKFGSARAGKLLPFAILLNGAGPQMPLSKPLFLESSAGARTPWAPNTPMGGLELGYVDVPHWNAYVGVGTPILDTGADAHTDLYGSAELELNSQGNSVGVFDYHGQIPATSSSEMVRYERTAFFANLYRPSLKGVVGLLMGRDRVEGEPTTKSTGAFVLGEFLLSNRVAAYGRYDQLRREQVVGDDQVTDGPTLGLSYWAQTQVRLTFEARFLKDTGSDRDRSASAELMWVF